MSFLFMLCRFLLVFPPLNFGVNLESKTEQLEVRVEPDRSIDGCPVSLRLFLLFVQATVLGPQIPPPGGEACGFSQSSLAHPLTGAWWLGCTELARCLAAWPAGELIFGHATLMF